MSRQRDLTVISLGDYICAILRTWPAFTTLAGDRVHRVDPPEGFTVPMLVYTVIGGETYQEHDDSTKAASTDAKTTLVQFSAFARSRKEATTLANAAHDALQLAQDATLRVNVAAPPRETKEGDLYRTDLDLELGHALAL